MGSPFESRDVIISDVSHGVAVTIDQLITEGQAQINEGR
jgi:hypothetical protein